MTIPTPRLFPSRRAQLLDWLRRSDPWHIFSLLIVLVVVLVGMWPKLPDAPPSAPLSTPVPIILLATPVPAMSIPVVALSAELRLVRAVVAYDAPEGKVLGATLPGRRYKLLARSGTAWVRLATHGSGSVWVRRDALEGVVDVTTPLPSVQPIVIAAEQRRVRPTALAATATPTTLALASPAPAPTVPRTIVYRNADGSIFAAYTCEPYGD
jgi:hypothetical protein